MKLIRATSRSCTILADEKGDFTASGAYTLTVGGKAADTKGQSVVSVFGLWPDTEYQAELVREDGKTETLTFRTEAESYSLDVRRFGAKGDGETEDTAALQAAILSCPRDGRVRIPAGIYRTGPLFLKSHITLEIQQGAELHLIDERPGWPVLPGTVFPAEGKGELLLGSWEGNPL
ncbi:MAG: glycoside hydrolase family 28 protein, partial [Clostridia bacterium]|nr:glycoside hydrolase family 28 protein [Clostridia bacterium]